MKRIHAVVAGIGAGVALAIGAVAYAQPSGAMGPGFGPGMSMSMSMGPGHGPMVGQQWMTPEERTDLQEKMRGAKTPEERQKLIEATRAQMQQRAKDGGITVPEHGGMGGGFGPGFTTQMH